MAYTYPALEWPSKWPDEVLDYSINWKEAPTTPASSSYPYVAVLDVEGGETISTINHAIIATADGDVDNPLTIDSQAKFDSDRQTVVWLSGGVTGTYRLSATIVTSAARTIYREITIKVF